MKSIFISSINARSGKTVITLGIALNSKVYTGFFKPFQEKMITVNNQRVEEDAYLMQSLLDFEANPADDPDLHIPMTTEEIHYVWDFGDGTKADGVVEDGKLVSDHKYLNPSEYIVTLTATDNSGLSKTSTVSYDVHMVPIEVPPPTPPETQFWEYLPWIVLALIVIIGVIVILVFVLRKEPLEEIAVEEEKHHEENTESHRAES